MEQKVEAVLSEDQFGFRKNRGTREAILALKLIIEKRMEMNMKTFIAFIDIEKAFDNVKWDKMFQILKAIGINYRDRRVIWNLYRNETAVINGRRKQEEVEIRKGVWQGCALSPIIFNLYIEEALKEQISAVSGTTVEAMVFSESVRLDRILSVLFVCYSVRPVIETIIWRLMTTHKLRTKNT